MEMAVNDTLFKIPLLPGSQSAPPTRNRDSSVSFVVSSWMRERISCSGGGVGFGLLPMFSVSSFRPERSMRSLWVSITPAVTSDRRTLPINVAETPKCSASARSEQRPNSRSVKASITAARLGVMTFTSLLGFSCWFNHAWL